MERGRPSSQAPPYCCSPGSAQPHKEGARQELGLGLAQVRVLALAQMRVVLLTTQGAATVLAMAFRLGTNFPDFLTLVPLPVPRSVVPQLGHSDGQL